MADVYFEPPMAGGGTPADQLQTLYRYLWQMSNKLNEAMTSVTIEQLDSKVQEKISAGEKAVKQNEASYNSVKSLIIKTADIVRNEMDVIRAQLEGSIEAQSIEFGTYQEAVTAEFEATARGITQNYDNIQTMETNYGTFIRDTKACIYSGELYADPDTGEPVFGIAIGQNVTDESGELVDANKYATFTAKELAFYVNGAKAAWFSNSVFNIDRGQILGSLQMGTRHIWQIMNGHLALMSLEEQQAEE